MPRAAPGYPAMRKHPERRAGGAFWPLTQLPAQPGRRMGGVLGNVCLPSYEGARPLPFGAESVFVKCALDVGRIPAIVPQNSLYLPCGG